MDIKTAADLLMRKSAVSCRVKRVFPFVAAFLSTTLAATHSLAISIYQSPLFVQEYAQSNLLLSIDDSLSMDAEMLFDTYDGMLWLNKNTSSIVDENIGLPYLEVQNDPDNKAPGDGVYVYLFPNGKTNAGGDRASNAGQALPPFPQYAFARSSDFNKAYYNPMISYQPWEDLGGLEGFSFPDAIPDKAVSDPAIDNDASLLALDTLQTAYKSASHWSFGVAKGSVIPKGTMYFSGGSWQEWTGTISNAADSGKDYKNYQIQYYPATYFVKTQEGSYKFSEVEGNCETPNPEHYQLFENNPPSFTESINSETDLLMGNIGEDGLKVNALAYDGSCLVEVRIENTSIPEKTYAHGHEGDRTDCSHSDHCTYTEEIQNFANWYSYYRKRHLALRGGMGYAFKDIKSVYADAFFINQVDGKNGNKSVPSELAKNVSMHDLTEDSDKKDLYETFYEYEVASGTPNRQGLKYAGKQYARTTDPLVEGLSCQKHFTLMFTDGYTENSNISGIGDEDGDGSKDTLADIAHFYYNHDNPDDSDLDFNMQTYMVGLNAKGSIYGVDYHNVSDVGDADISWPEPLTRDKTQIDDMFHAAVNSDGEMFNATSAADLANTLEEALTKITSLGGSASAASVSSNTLTTGDLVFVSTFDSQDWSGNLKAYAIEDGGLARFSDGTLKPPVWNAAGEFESALTSDSDYFNTRTVITSNGSEGVPFRWDELTEAQKADFAKHQCGESCNSEDAEGGQKDALNYIRGDRSKESNENGFRERNSILADIIGGGSVYVGPSRLNWPSLSPFPTQEGKTHAEYKETTVDRHPVVYTASNGGMLHGFDATNGKEVLAYIPSMIYSDQEAEGLHYLTQTDYQHRFYVDQEPTVLDVVIDDSWRTVLVGGLGAGGKGIYALDISGDTFDIAKPAFSEDEAEEIVLWEFTSSDSVDLGQVYDKPNIAMMENGRWAAIFGNGYNSASGKAKLMIVFLDGGIDGTWTPGSDFIVIDTDTTTDNGLSPARLVDVDQNGAVDRVYAGDLKGRMWAFDLSDKGGDEIPDPDATPDWKLAYDEPLFTAEYTASTPQPITSKPTVVFHSEEETDDENAPNLMVLFGTGSYLGLQDLSDKSVQSFYGIHDTGNYNLDRDDLQSQQLSIIQVKVDGVMVDSDHRKVTDNAVGDKDGWYFDLMSGSAEGERSVLTPSVKGKTVYFAAWTPASDPCLGGGSTFIMSVSQINGGPTNGPAFDFNGDGKISYQDKVKTDPDDDASGVISAGRTENGLINFSISGGAGFTTGVVGENDNNNPDCDRSVEDVCIQGLGNTEDPHSGRLSWQEMEP